MAEPSRDQLLKNVVAQIRSQLKDETAIMQLGETALTDVPGIPTGALEPGHRPGRPRPAARPRDRDLRAGVERQDDRGAALPWPTPRSRAAWPRSSTPSTPSIPGWAKRLGVDLESLLVSQPSSGEEALKIAEMLVKSNAVDIIVIDSVAALVPRAEVEGEIGDSHVGLQARLMSQALRILNADRVARRRRA